MPAPGLTVKLISGPRVLNINSGRYSVADDFYPPGVALVPLMAGGTSANRWGGSERAGLGAVNRTWVFGVNVRNCASAAEVRAAVADLAFMLSLAGDPDAPLYLYFRPHSNMTATPLWGQDGYYYEIAHADPPELPAGGFYAFLSGQGHPGVTISCSIRPFARGKWQAVGSATGGVLEDTLGTVDGQSRGLYIPQGTTNKMTNPAFTHATWDNGWTAAAGLDDIENNDSEFILFGESSARLVAASDADFYQTINVGNTNAHTLSAYVKRPDGAAVTSADCVLIYGANQTTTFRAMGNGWYLATAAVTGVAAGQATGINVKARRAIYLAFTQIEEKSVATPPCYGDLLGCAWTGTAHASTSTRTAGRWRVPVDESVFRVAQGTARVVWRTDYAQSAYGSDVALWDTGDIRASFLAAGDTWELNDGTQVAGSSAQTFTPGTVIVLHFTWGPSGLAIYINGAVNGTNATYTPSAMPSYVYLGTNDSGATNTDGCFQGLTIWPSQATAAEVLADYNNIAPLVADSQRVDTIPWRWTFDGDDVIDTLYDGTAWNAFVCGGIPGSAPAQTAMKITGSAAISGFSSIWLGVLPADVYIPLSNFFEEQTGTSSIGTTLATTSKAISLPPYRFYRWMQGREWHLFAPCSTAGSGLSLAAALLYTSGGVEAIVNEEVGVVADGTNRTFWTRAIVLRRLRHVYQTNPYFQIAYDVGLYAKHSGGTANLTVDKLFLVPRPLTQIEMPHTTSETLLHVSGPNAQITTTTGDVPEELAYVRGDEFELFPAVYNHVITVQGDPVRAYSATLTFTINSLLALPRYLLL
jgi:hypothetical protein